MGKSTCSFNGCGRASRAKGMCDAHYQQNRKGKELRPLQPSPRGLPLEQRFWGKVQKTESCWLWTASTTSRGYGQIKVDGRLRLAHRVSWEFAHGPTHDGLELDHRCGNRACVNPEHLRVTTRSQNQQHRTGANKNSNSGIRGVSWNKRANAWKAQVQLNGRFYYGGYHPTLEAADAAARALRARLHSHDDYDQWVKTQAASAENAEAA